jgi:hypothetical protein
LGGCAENSRSAAQRSLDWRWQFDRVIAVYTSRPMLRLADVAFVGRPSHMQPKMPPIRRSVAVRLSE